MKFSPDKLKGNDTPPPAPETSEMTQEEYDAQIEARAGELGVKLEELDAEVKAEFGSWEIFAEKMYSRYDHQGRNLAGSMIFKSEREIEDQEKYLKRNVAIGIVVSLAAYALKKYGGSLSGFHGGINDLFENGFDSAEQVTTGVYIAALSTGAVVAIVQAIRNVFKKRKEVRQMNVNKLKFDIAGVDVKK